MTEQGMIALLIDGAEKEKHNDALNHGWRPSHFETVSIKREDGAIWKDGIERGNRGEYERYFSGLCHNETPITIMFADEPDYRLDCIPQWLTREEYCVIVDENDNRHGLKRGQITVGDPEEIGDVIIREKQPAAQSA